mgnify:CR=1 FL=1
MYCVWFAQLTMRYPQLTVRFLQPTVQFLHTVYLSTPLVGHILKTHDKESPQSLRTFH